MIMISEVYDAFISAGVPEDKARKASEALAQTDGRFANVEANLLLLKWMLGFNLAFSMAIVAKIIL